MEYEDYDTWNDNEQIQMLYTLVRKNNLLAPMTRGKLFKLLCDTIYVLCEALESGGMADPRRIKMVCSLYYHVHPKIQIVETQRPRRGRVGPALSYCIPNS